MNDLPFLQKDKGEKAADSKVVQLIGPHGTGPSFWFIEKVLLFSSMFIVSCRLFAIYWLDTLQGGWLREKTSLRKICNVPTPSGQFQMDATLKTLVNVEHLSLGTNMIEKIENVGSLKTLKILSLGRNCIKALTGLLPPNSYVNLEFR